MRRLTVLCCLCLSMLVRAEGGTDPAEISAAGQEEAFADAPADLPAQVPGEAPPGPSSTRGLMQEQALERQLPGQQQRRLDIGAQAYLGLYLPAARPQPLGGVLLIADRGEHADWPQITGPARQLLSEAGWHTMAISLPDMPEPDTRLQPEEREARAAAYGRQAVERIQAAGQVLAAEATVNGRQQPLAFLGRGEGAYWALSAALDNSDQAPQGLILFDMHDALFATSKSNLLLEQWDAPVYEILPATGRAGSDVAHERHLLSKRMGNTRYAQLVLAQPDYSEQGQQMLIKRLDGWLQRALLDQRNPR